MSFINCIRFGAILTATTLSVGVAFAAPPRGVPAPRGVPSPPGGRVGGAPIPVRPVPALPGARPVPLPAYNPPPRYVAPYNPGSRVVIGIGLGGGGLYGPLTYGLGGSPYLYGGSSYYGSLGTGSLGYGYPGASLGVPAIPGTYYPQYQYVPPAMPPAVDPNAEPTPLPLPNPNAGDPGSPLAGGNGETATAKITVVANPGAKVSFDGIESDQNGTRHSFTTKPLSKGAETRVKVVVDGSSISIGVRGGETATIDMRK